MSLGLALNYVPLALWFVWSAAIVWRRRVNMFRLTQFVVAGVVFAIAVVIGLVVIFQPVPIAAFAVWWVVLLAISYYRREPREEQDP